MTVKLPDNYKLSEKDDYMNDQQKEYFRLKLEAWKDELLNESSDTLEHLKEENWNEADEADRATVEIDTGLELRTRDRYRKLIDKINAALSRIENDEYGYCVVTDQPIGLQRLDARPIATMTVEAQEQHEMNEKRSYG